MKKILTHCSFLILFALLNFSHFTNANSQSCSVFLMNHTMNHTLLSTLNKLALDFSIRKEALLSYIEKAKGRITSQEFFSFFNTFTSIEQMKIAEELLDWPHDRGKGWGGWENYQAIFLRSVSQILVTGTEKELLAILKGPMGKVLYTDPGDYNSSSTRAAYDKRRYNSSNLPLGSQSEGFTTLMYASQKGYLNVVKLLVEEFKVNINLIKPIHNYGLQPNTALSYAIFFNKDNQNDQVISYLLKMGANLSSQNTYYPGPLYYAAAIDDVEMLKLLLEYGADINDQTKIHETALFAVAKYGQTNAAKFLLEAGIDYNARLVELEKNDFGKTVEVDRLFKDTASAVAKQGGYIEVADLILEFDKASKGKTYNPSKFPDRIWRFFKTL